MFEFLNNINIIIVIINVVTFVIFGIDKAKSKGKGMRVPEIVLLLLSLFFGGVGALLGMVVFNHKTSKPLFRTVVPLSFALNYIFWYNSFGILKAFLKWLLDLLP